MTTRISDKRKRELLEAMDESIMQASSLYFSDPVSKFLGGLRGKGAEGSLASNSRTQLCQSAWKDSLTGRKQELPKDEDGDDTTWGTGGAIERYKSVFVEYATPTQGFRMACDILFTRAMPAVIMFTAVRALATLPSTVLNAEAKKRFGKDASKIVKFIKDSAAYTDSVLELVENKGKKRKSATKISWSAISTPRKKKAKTPKSALVDKAISDTTPNRPSVSKDEASLLIHMESKVPEVCAQFDNGWDLGMLAKGMLEGNSLKELKMMSKDELTEAAVLDAT